MRVGCLRTERDPGQEALGAATAALVCDGFLSVCHIRPRPAARPPHHAREGFSARGHVGGGHVHTTDVRFRGREPTLSCRTPSTLHFAGASQPCVLMPSRVSSAPCSERLSAFSSKPLAPRDPTIASPPRTICSPVHAFTCARHGAQQHGGAHAGLVAHRRARDTAYRIPHTAYRIPHTHSIRTWLSTSVHRTSATLLCCPLPSPMPRSVLSSHTPHTRVSRQGGWDPKAGLRL